MHVDEDALREFVGARLMAARKRRRWSRLSLARRSGLTYRMVSYIELGTHPASLTAYFNLARTLGVVWGELFPPYGVRKIHAPKITMKPKENDHDYAAESRGADEGFPDI